MGILTTILNKYFAAENQAIVNNIFSTLFLGTVYMQACEYFKIGFKNKQIKVIGKGLLFFLTPILTTIGIIILMSGNIQSHLTFFKLYVLLIPNLAIVEGGFLFVVLAVLFYLFHGHKVGQIISLIVIGGISLFANGLDAAFTTNYQWMMIFASIPIILYNGEKGKGMRNFFYFFYPIHIAVLAIIGFYIN
ncbi:hypothetical protein IGI52_000992 [Enterococcus sp. DIV0187]